MFLRNAWYLGAWAHELREANILCRRLLDDPILIFRDSAGVPRALLDMCPHKFAPLSKGRICEDRVVCGYHGLAFDGSGQCVHNPHGPISGQLRVRSYPVVERHQALWLWLGDEGKLDPALIPDLSFIDEAPVEGRIFGQVHMRAGYQLIADNILDLTHADYLHATTLGGIITGAKVTIEESDDSIYVHWWSADVEPPPAFKYQVPSGARADMWTEVLWSAPAVMVMHTGAVPTGVPRPAKDTETAVHIMTPETSGTSHYFFCMARQTNLGPEFSAMLKESTDRVFLEEDKPMLEAQQERIGDRELSSMHPMLLNIDSAGMRARRRIARLIQERDGV